MDNDKILMNLVTEEGVQLKTDGRKEEMFVM